MSDPVNSSDEVMQMAWQAVIDAASKGQIYELAIDDELDEFAAAVRAEAVADERRRIMWRLEDAEIANLELVSDEAYHLLKSIIFPSLAAGPVLVATPEPDNQSRRDLIVCSHCLLTPAEIDALDHHSGGWCPGPVATPAPCDPPS